MQDMIGPFNAEEAGVRMLHTRTAMFVPFELVSLLLDQDYTAKEAFHLSFPILEADGLDGVCRPFLKFLQVAATQTSEVVTHPVTCQDHLGLKGHPVRPTVVKACQNSVL
jgi:hypothetical protein